MDDSFNSSKIIIIETGEIAGVGDILFNLKNTRWSYLGNNWAIYNAIRRDLSTYGQEICSGPLINDKASKIRRSYLDFENIIFDNQDDLLWQTTDVAEKSIINNSLLSDVCKCLVSLDLVRETTGSLVLIIDDIFLGEFLRSLIGKINGINATLKTSDQMHNTSQFVVHCLRTIKAWKRSGVVEINNLYELMSVKKIYVDELRAIRNKKLIKNKNIDILIVTWGDPNTFSSETYLKNDYIYGELPRHLLRSNLSLAYLVLPVDWQYPFENIINNTISAKDDVYTLYDCIEIDGAKKLAMKAIDETLKLKQRFEISGIDFTPLLKKSYHHEKSKSRQFWALNYYYIAKYFKNNHINITNIIIPYENQPWEKSLRYGFSSWMANTRIIQYAFGAYGKFWLSAYPGKKDLEVGNIPDLLSVFGRKYRDIFINEGFQDNKVTVWPAFRFKSNEGEAFKDNRKKTNSDILNILIILNISPDSSLELLSKTLLASKDLMSEHFRIRFHPRMGPPAQVLNLLMDICKGSKLPNNLEISSERSLSEDLDWSDGVLINGSDVEIEAALRGCYTIFVKSECDLDINKLPIEEHDAVVCSIKEINIELNQLRNNLKKLVKTPWTKEKRDYWFEPIKRDTLKKVLIDLGIGQKNSNLNN